VCGVDARRHGAEARETAGHEPGARQQYERKRELCDDQRVARAVSRTIRAAART
jgi:hypothetical protein